MRTALFIALLTGTASVALAQSATAPKPPKDASMYFSDADLQGIMRSIPPSKETGKPGGFSKRLFADTTYSTAFIRLIEPDQPHAHGTWSEVFVIKEGSGVLETGGSITGETGHSSATHGALFLDQQGKPRAAAEPPSVARHEAPGDLAGTGIEGGHQQQVGPGDVILIPAGVAHHWLKVDQPVVYLDTKFPKAE